MYTQYDLERAIELAIKAHAKQVDKQGYPYILHPLRVMDKAYAKAIATGHLDPIAIAISAVLHDVVEDTHVTLSQIRASFGARVARVVDILSHKKGLEYLSYIRYVKLDADATLIKLEDLGDNMARGNKFPSLMTRYEKATLILNETF